MLNLSREFRLLRRVTLCQQPQRVTRKGRHVSCAPKKQGFLFIQHHYHAVPELACVKKHAGSDSWYRKLMKIALDNQLAKVDQEQSQKRRAL